MHMTNKMHLVMPSGIRRTLQHLSNTIINTDLINYCFHIIQSLILQYLTASQFFVCKNYLIFGMKNIVH